MKRIAIQNVGVVSAARFGCVLGGLIGFIPGLLLAIAIKLGVSALRDLLESWQNVDIADVFGQSVRTNVITLLHLEGLLGLARAADSDGWVLGVGLVLFFCFVAAILSGLVSGVGAMVYNATAEVAGGMELTTREVQQVPEK